MNFGFAKKAAKYLFNNFLGNFLGFIIGIASTRLASRFFATRSIKNLWGLTSHKAMVDKKTFSNIEWAISVIIGFIVFEIISKWLKKKIEQQWPKYKMWVAHKLSEGQPVPEVETAKQ